MNPKRYWPAVSLVLLMCLWIGASGPRVVGQDIDSLLDKDPLLRIPAPTLEFDPSLADLWIDVLSAREADMRRRAAESFVRAEREGLTGFEHAGPALAKLLERPDPHPAVRIAVSRALCALDVRSAAPILFEELDRDGLDAAIVIEPALAHWGYEPIYARWRERLQNSQVARRYLLLAVNGLGEVRDTSSEQPLRDMVADASNPADIRFAAARALARIRTDGLVDQARELYERSSTAVIDRTLAALLLAEHTDEAALDLLDTMARDPEPAVGNLALERLYETAPERIRRYAEQLLAQRDANLRMWAARAIAQEPNLEHLHLLAQRLVDPHPRLRVFARDALLKFAEDEQLKAAVLASAEQLLDGDDWRGLEQAIQLVAQLDHEPVAMRVFELVSHPRNEVGVTAAWGIRKLSVAETLSPALEYCTELTGIISNPATAATVQGDFQQRLSQLFQLFGEHRYAASIPLMRSYAPSKMLPPEPRAAAIWTLAYIYEHEPPEDFCQILIARLNDVGTTPPESDRVRHLAAVALGRMKYEPALPTLQKWFETEAPHSKVGYACAWAISQITDGELVPPEPVKRYFQGWFLTPHDE